MSYIRLVVIKKKAYYFYMRFCFDFIHMFVVRE